MLVGTWLKYDAMIKAARQRFLDIAYAHGLKSSYEHIDNYLKKLELLINTSIGSNIEDEITEIRLHHEIINSKKVSIPTWKYIMPKSTAKWNLKKRRQWCDYENIRVMPCELTCE